MRTLPGIITALGLLAALAGCNPATPGTAAPVVSLTGVSASASGTAAAVLATLPVKPLALAGGYSRAQFGTAWADTDHNGCDQRDDVLRRDLTGIAYRKGSRCVVTSGTLHDPYTGRTIAFAKAAATKVQIDHVVALSDAWQTGAATWTAAQRLTYATDETYVLLAVDGPTNEAKGDADAASWLPITSYQCPYVARQIAIKKRYGLWVTPSERAAMTRVLATCPRQAIPTRGGA